MISKMCVQVSRPASPQPPISSWTGRRGVAGVSENNPVSPEGPARALGRPAPFSARQWVVFAAILVLAALARFAQLGSIPPGLWYDEALYCLDGYKVSQGEFAWFFAEHGHPREPLFPWLLGLAFALIEPTVLAARGVSALAGTAAVGLMLPVARRFLPPWWALAATTAFAAFRWHIHFSRTIFRAGLASPLALLTVWLFFRWKERRRPVDAALLGAACAAGLYTYISLRMLPVLVAVWLGWMLWEKTASLRKDGAQMMIMAGAALLLFLPLGIDYARHPEHFSGRTDEVTMFEKDVVEKTADGREQVRRVAKTPGEVARGLLGNAAGVAGVWFVKGDYVARHGIPYKPVLDPLSGLLFTAGLVLAVGWIIRGRRRGAAGDVGAEALLDGAPLRGVVLLSWFAAFAAASVLSYGAPNILRMQGASPVVILLMVLGLKWATERGLTPLAAPLRRAVVVLYLGVFAAMQVGDYFRVFPKDLRVRSGFGAEFFYAPAEAAAEMAKQGKTVYVPREFLDSLQVKFITIGQPNVVPYDPDKPLPGLDSQAGTAAWLLTMRSLALAQEHGLDQAAELKSRHLSRNFSVTVTDDEGRLVLMQPWAQLWE